ncbi:MAG TPA: penicillin acylase family protein [Vicinamibacterales bacterium]|nr:penicillin acylase family protein [Vicinamibacterales bacterium]
MQRWFLRASIALAIVVALAVAGVYVFLRRSLPQMDGTITVSGISAPVDIIRDADSVTHVFGATKLDVYYGLGYAHAQDRLWQMEFQRRVGMGRLSEIFGVASVNTDRFLRTLGTGRAARSAWDFLPDETKTSLNAYVAGVNAFIATHHGSQLPLEFTLLRFEPEPWTGPDVLAWVKMMAWDLSKNYSFELLRHDLTALLGHDRAASLLPPYRQGALTILSEADVTWAQKKLATAEDAEDAEVSKAKGFSAFSASSAVESLVGAFGSTQIPGVGSALGSNNWVVDGTMTASGKPLLANDPHLDAQIPSLWYLAHLSAGDFDVIGATLPGAPAVVLGRNKFIAWGATNVMADVQDLYREHVDRSGRFVEFRGRLQPVQVVQETIRVKGGPPLTLNVRLTRHGPIISDAINANNLSSIPQGEKPSLLEPLAFRWTALDTEDSSVTAFLRLNEARNWTEFTDALRDYVVPAQNFVYADVDGHIGYYAPARYPIRDKGDGSEVVDGWTGDAEWIGWVPFDEQPHAYDPPSHFIVTANNKPTPPNYSPVINGEFIEPHRAERIVHRLRETKKLTPDDFASIQADTYSTHAKELLPILLQRVHPTDAQDTQAVQILKEWNFDARGDSAAAAIFQSWYYELPIAVVGDELGPRLTSDYLGLDRSSARSRFLFDTLKSKDNAWCDDVRTPKKETCDDTVSIALHAAIERLSRSLGDDMRSWRWDSVHRAIFAHSVFNTLPVIGRWLRREAGHGGDWSSVDVGAVFAQRPFEQHSLPGYRDIIDLSTANDSRFLDAVGQSGHRLSPHYDDALPLWAYHKYRKMRTDRAEIENGAIGHLRLAPK